MTQEFGIFRNIQEYSANVDSPVKKLRAVHFLLKLQYQMRI
jgi:hypothetical protein